MMQVSIAAADEAGMVSLSGQILSAVSGLGYTAVPLRVGRGELISLQDGWGRGVHVLSRGRMKILRFSDAGRVLLLELVEPGDVFGELAFLSDAGGSHVEVGPSYAEALEEATVYSIPCLIFERLLRAHPGLALGIARLLGERCNKLERRLEAHVFHKVPTRLVNQLLELAEHYGVEHEGGTLLSIPLSQQDLGNLIGASREIVSLTLSDLKKRGLVGSQGRRLVVHEDRLREELARITN
jgi:CRP/FNR family transcriptional regulator